MSEREGVLALLQRSVEEVLGEEAPTLTEDLVLADAEIDSLDLVEMIMVIEEAEGYTIDAADVEGAEAVSDLIDTILAKRSARP